MTDRELMKLALEALDWAADCIEPRKPHNCDCPVCVASDALLQRLTDSTIHSCSYYCERPDCVKAQRNELRERLAQPEQEPVAWVTGWHDGHCVIRAANPSAILPIGIALYTAPPRREWVGLTEAEKVNVAIACGCADVAWMDFADAIEAKLREKNS